MVKLLAEIISLHANLADRYMNNEISYSAYADVSGFAILSGRYLAKNVWQRYGKCLRKKDSGEQTDKQPENTEEKLFM